jgi:hypothetical protein
MQHKLRARSIALVVIVNIVVTIGLLEIVLRVQQRVGPLYDLDFHPETMMIERSEELNHVPIPGEYWDRDGIRRMDEPNAARCSPTILFLGDSFMQGVQRGHDGNIIASFPSDTVPIHVRDFFRQSLGKEVCVVNAGYSSYSPSIFVPQAKKLIPRLKPDIVVIDVDETDLYDDYYRYRQLVTRDAAGSIIAVRASPINVQFIRGLRESTNKTLYLHRLLSKLYFTRIEFPRLLARYERDRPSDGFWVSKLPADKAKEEFGEGIAYFKRTLDDLTQTVVLLMGKPDALVYIHHPHLEHLSANGAVFNDIVSETLREVASRHGVKYHDFVPDLKAEFGAEPRQYYIPNDMHLNAAGTRAYGIAVAQFLAASLGHN